MLETTAECFRLVLLIEWTSNSIQYFCCHNNAKFDLKPVVIYMHLNGTFSYNILSTGATS